MKILQWSGTILQFLKYFFTNNKSVKVWDATSGKRANFLKGNTVTMIDFMGLFAKWR